MSRLRARVAGRLPAAMACLPLLVAGWRAIGERWYPIGDNAFFPLRARDVLTEHHPLLGTWTSASLTVGTTIHNPGPLLFDVLALPAKVDPIVGTIVAVVGLHVAAVLLAIHWARRVADGTGAWAVAAAFVALEWAMGSEILVEPWQPHSLLPAFLCYLVLVWALVAGHGGALPWAVGVGSLIVQTHLSYALLVPGLGLLGVAILVGSAWRDPWITGGWPAIRRPVLVAVAVFALAWLQPGIDQVLGDGNLLTVAQEGGGGAASAGPRFAARVLGSVGMVPGGWAPGGFDGLDVYLRAGPSGNEAGSFPGLASEVAALVGLMGGAVVMGVAASLTNRRRDRAWGSGLAVAVVALLLAFASVALLPVSEVLGVAAHQLRPVWPVVLFSTAITVAALDRAVRSVERLLPVAALVGMLLALPAHNPRTGPSADAAAIPVTRALVEQLDPLEGAGLVYVDLSVIRFAEPYSTPVMLDLQRRGIDFVVDGESAAQLGQGRAIGADDEVDVEIRVVEGDAALRPEVGWERIAFVPGLNDDEQRELDALNATVDSGATLDAQGARRRRELDRRRFFESAAVLVRDAA